jgi:hypothetical protein
MSLKKHYLNKLFAIFSKEKKLKKQGLKIN